MAPRAAAGDYTPVSPVLLRVAGLAEGPELSLRALTPFWADTPT
ncbi:MAG: hypothetical protein ACI8PZ_005468 [Myxococcota bacterium]|jgi:hypothetical protein